VKSDANYRQQAIALRTVSISAMAILQQLDAIFLFAMSAE
jgi:hypothetical protein